MSVVEAMPQGRVEIDEVSIMLGRGAQSFEAVRKLSLSIAPGEFVAILGPSGCGKSTLLGALAGHIPVGGGRLLVDQAPVRGPDPSRGIVFQHHTLLPWRTALENVAFGPKMRGEPRAQRLASAAEMLATVGLSGFENRYPAELSGGMQQRVEIARVLINRPRLLLMDEPFGALDAQTRLMMQSLLLDIWSRVRTTVVFVTHDIDEALFLADRVLIMTPRPGRTRRLTEASFPRPRDVQLTTEPEFARLKRQCLDLLRPDADDQPLPRLTPLGLAAAGEPERRRSY